MFSLTAMRVRARDGTFWQRIVSATVMGYFYALTGFSLVFALLGFLSTAIKYPPDGIFWGVAGFILVVPHIFLMMFIVGIIAGVQIMVGVFPMVLILGLGLTTKKAGTIIVWAVLGALLATPLVLGSIDKLAKEEGLVQLLCCVGAGVMFALTLWRFCLRYYNAPDEAPQRGRFMQWWKSRGIITKLAVLAAIPFVVFFFL